MVGDAAGRNLENARERYDSLTIRKRSLVRGLLGELGVQTSHQLCAFGTDVTHMRFILQALQRFGCGPSLMPRGYYLLRYYKESHRDRIVHAVTLAQIGDAILVKDAMAEAAGKVAVYCKSDTREAESLFFQYYAMAKQEERERRPVQTRLA